MPDHETPGVFGDPAITRAVRALLDDFPMDQVVEDAITEVRELAPEFESVDTDRLRKDMEGALGLAVAAIRDGSGSTDAEVTGLRAIGALRAEQGIDMDSMLNGFRVIARTSIDAVLVTARERGIASDVTLVLTRAVWAHCDHAAVQLAAGHRAFSEDPSRPVLRRGEAALRTLVRGETSAERRTEAWAELGVSPSRKYRVVALSALAGPPTTLGGAVERRLLGMYADTDGDRVIGLVDVLPKEPWDCRVGYGDAARPRTCGTPTRARCRPCGWPRPSDWTAPSTPRTSGCSGRCTRCPRSGTSSSSAASGTSTRPGGRRWWRRCGPGSPPRAASTRRPRRSTCTATRCATGSYLRRRDRAQPGPAGGQLPGLVGGPPPRRPRALTRPGRRRHRHDICRADRWLRVQPDDT